MLFRRMTFSTMPMMRTPTTVPLIVPIPPVSDTPPRTQAEIACNSSLSPALLLAITMRDAGHDSSEGGDHSG